MTPLDAIIIGAGHNGLVTAAYLAKAGKKVLVLERRPVVGGIAVSEEIYPGFKYPTCAHLCASFSTSIIHGLELGKHGLELLRLDPLLFAPLPDGGSLRVPREPAKRSAEISRFSKSDAAKLAAFDALAKRLVEALRILIAAPMPAGRAFQGKLDIAGLAKLGWSLQRLGQERLQEFLRVFPMAAADFLDEWFETEILKAALAAPGLFGGFVGPRAQGTAYVLLHQLLGGVDGGFRTSGLVRGGIGNLTQALARSAMSFGAEIRTNCQVDRILTAGGKAVGAALSTGEEFHAAAVIANADVKQTFTKLVEPTDLDPHFLLDVRNIRARGTVAKVNLAVNALPKFKGSSPAGAEDLAGIIYIGPTLEYLERAADDAKYGRFSRRPWLEITIPSLRDPSLAPTAKHVISVWMQYAPFHLKEAEWKGSRETLGDVVVGLIDEYAPGFKDSVLHRQVLTPLDLAETFGLTEGHPDHAELALDQAFFMRPVAGWARYRTPIRNLYLCGSGTHPGGGISGLPGFYAAREILTDLERKPERLTRSWK